MFVEELKLLFSPLFEDVNILFRVFNKGVPISNEITIFILALFIVLLFIMYFSMWFVLRRKSKMK